jgi:hypothetical protein
MPVWVCAAFGCHVIAIRVSVCFAIVSSHVAVSTCTLVKLERSGVLIVANAVAVFVDSSLFEAESVVRIRSALPGRKRIVELLFV